MRSSSPPKSSSSRPANAPRQVAAGVRRHSATIVSISPARPGRRGVALERVGERQDVLRDGPHQGRLVAEAREGAGRDDAAHAIWVVDRDAERVHRAHRVADDDGRCHLQRLHHGGGVGREVAGAVARRGIAAAVAALRQRDDVLVVGQPRQHRQHRLEGTPGVGDAVQQEQRRATAAALLDELEAEESETAGLMQILVDQQREEIVGASLLGFGATRPGLGLPPWA